MKKVLLVGSQSKEEITQFLQCLNENINTVEIVVVESEPCTTGLRSIPIVAPPLIKNPHVFYPKKHKGHERPYKYHK